MGTRSGTEQTVCVVDPSRSPLLALLLRGVLKDRLATERGRARARRIHGTVVIAAGRMSVAVRFDPSGVTISQDVSVADARVEGDLAALLDVVAGGGITRPVMTRKVRVHGSLVLLLRVLSVLQSGAR